MDHMRTILRRPASDGRVSQEGTLYTIVHKRGGMCMERVYEQYLMPNYR